MAKTSTHWANEVLEKLGMVGLGQSPDAEDTEKALGKFEAFSAYLDEAQIFTIADPDDIPLAAFEWLVVYGAYFCANAFSKPQDDTMRQTAEWHLIRLQAGRPSKELMQAEYF